MKSMDKTQIIAQMIRSLEADLATLNASMMENYTTATAEENIARSKYDTLALEASYLVQGQSRRSEELEEALISLRNFTLQDFDASSKIAMSALVTLESEEGIQRTVLLAPIGGALKVEVDGVEISLMTVVSPMGRAIMGHYLGDIVELNIAGQIKDFDVVGLS
mgnify:CR=1 FL=1